MHKFKSFLFDATFYVLAPLECVLAILKALEWRAAGSVAPAELVGTLLIAAPCALVTWLAYSEIVKNLWRQVRSDTGRSD